MITVLDVAPRSRFLLHDICDLAWLALNANAIELSQCAMEYQRFVNQPEAIGIGCSIDLMCLTFHAGGSFIGKALGTDAVKVTDAGCCSATLQHLKSSRSLR